MLCLQVVILGRREEHESKCQFARTVCPIGGEECGILRLNQIDSHMTSCSRVPCPFSNFGEIVTSSHPHTLTPSHPHIYVHTACMYHGTTVDVAEHTSTCSYNDESQLLIITMREVSYTLKLCIHTPSLNMYSDQCYTITEYV